MYHISNISLYILYVAHIFYFNFSNIHLISMSVNEASDGTGFALGEWCRAYLFEIRELLHELLKQ